MAEQMKPSGIDWIGDIPNEWGITKVRFVTKLRSEQGFYNSDDKYIGLENISSYTGEYISTESEYDAGTYDLYKAGDLLFSKLRPYLAKALIADDCGFCTGELAVIKEYNGDIRYLFYYMLSDGFLKMVDASTYGAKMPRASWDYIKNLQIPVMRKSEQQTITDFLDKECAQIDSIVVDLEKQIELLQQYKKSLITETVTKGLDKSVPMKDSGIEWIGEIPAHWDVKRFKDECSKIGDIDDYMPDSTDEGIPYIMTGGSTGDENNIDFVNCKRISREDYIRLSKKMKPMYGDILLARYATIGTVRIVDIHEEFLVSYACAIIRIKESSYSKYIYYYLKSNTYSEEISQYIKTNTQANVGIDSIGRAKVPVPPIEEQKQISEFLDKKCHEINLVLRDKEKQLLKIQQHKKSLIYEYVTGKKRVKEVQ